MAIKLFLTKINIRGNKAISDLFSLPMFLFLGISVYGSLFSFTSLNSLPPLHQHHRTTVHCDGSSKSPSDPSLPGIAFP